MPVNCPYYEPCLDVRPYIESTLDCSCLRSLLTSDIDHKILGVEMLIYRDLTLLDRRKGKSAVSARRLVHRNPCPVEATRDARVWGLFVACVLHDRGIWGSKQHGAPGHLLLVDRRSVEAPPHPFCGTYLLPEPWAAQVCSSMQAAKT